MVGNKVLLIWVRFFFVLSTYTNIIARYVPFRFTLQFNPSEIFDLIASQMIVMETDTDNENINIPA